MTNGLVNGDEGNGPWWVAATLRMGVPAALAVYLVYYVTSTMSATVATKTDIGAMKSEMTVMTTVLGRHVDLTDQHMREIERLLGIQCANSAKTAVDRTSCFR